MHIERATMTFKIYLLLLAFVATTSFASTTEKQTYIIHMDKTKITALDTSLPNSKRWYEAIIDSIAQSSSQQQQEEEETSPPQLLYVYETAISGFAAKLSAKQVTSLKKINGFLFATPDELLSLQTTHTPEFLGLKAEKGLWQAQSLASDVIIGVVDTGIWPEHISFRDTGMSHVPSRWKGKCEEGTKFGPKYCNNKLIGGRAFLKGYEGFTGKINETGGNYRSARDSDGHGTHTASTTAGNAVPKSSFLGMAKGSARGMRYTSRIAAYKACWPLGCASSDLLAAIDQAVKDGVDVLSMSVGGAAKPYYSDNMAIASFGAIKKGIFVSCAAGNSGPTPSSISNVSPWITTVAASYIDRSFPTRVKLGNSETFIGASLYSGGPTKQLPIVFNSTAGGRGAEYCISGSLTRDLVEGKIVLCTRGINGRTQKAEQVKLAGGAGMLLINTEDEGEELFADPHILPATSLGALAGKSIKDYVSITKNPTASIMFEGTVYGTPAPVMAAFSSRGPSPVGPDVIKPDVTAPGVNILAAWPPIVSPTKLKTDTRSVLFNIISGTSMSCPHVSGLAALIRGAHMDWSTAAIKSALMTTAYTLDNKKAPIGDASSSNGSKVGDPFAFGSGHVDPERASDPGLIYDITPEDYLNYLCSLNYTTSQIAVFSPGGFTCPSDADLQPGDLNYPSFAVLFRKNALNMTIAFKRTVTNVGKAVSAYGVKVVEPNGVSVIVEPKVLNFRMKGEKLSYKVSFTSAGGSTSLANSIFGSLVWVSGKYSVRSPIAVNWE